MTTFTPLEDSASSTNRGAVVRRGRGHEPIGIVIDRSCRVYISNIPLNRIEQDGASAMKKEFEDYGPVESYRMFTDIAGRFTGAALCTYRNPADATMAVMNLNNQLFGDSVLSVTAARDHGVVMLRRNNNSNDSAALGKWIGSLASAQARGGGGNEGRDGAGRLGGHDVNAAESPTEDGKWRHDRYETHLRGELAEDEGEGLFGASYTSSMSRLRGRGGRGGRGGRRMTAAERTNMHFERYVMERDRLLGGEEGVREDGGNEERGIVGLVTPNTTPAEHATTEYVWSAVGPHAKQTSPMLSFQEDVGVTPSVNVPPISSPPSQTAASETDVPMPSLPPPQPHTVGEETGRLCSPDGNKRGGSGGGDVV